MSHSLGPRFIQLYRRLLILHHQSPHRTPLSRPLPPQMASLGLSYIRSEFEAHRKVVQNNDDTALRFLDGWEDYINQMVQMDSEKAKGVEVQQQRDTVVREDELTQEQREKLKELRDSVSEAFTIGREETRVLERKEREKMIEITRVEAGQEVRGFVADIGR